MKLRNALFALRVVSIVFCMLIAFGIPLSGQETPLQKEASAPKQAPAMNEVLRQNIENWALQGRGVPSDWSHHHLIFSNPGTEEDAIANGTHDRWLKIVNDPRYILQQMKRSSGVKTLGDPETASLEQAVKTESIKTGARTRVKKDWREIVLAHGQVQPNMYPAKFSFDITTASCSTDFVVYPTGVAGAGAAANIFAYSNLYTGGCTGTVPSVQWAYNTGTGYMVTTSPIISDDSTGSQVAYIQSDGTRAYLVLLKWAASTTQTLSKPKTLTVQASASDYRSCVAPCFYTVSLGADDTYSAPFYDYASDDAIYAGDDTGRLHKITGVFNGTTIGEASGWPKTLNASYQTTSPVYDPTSGYVFVGNTNGVLYAVDSTNASIHGESSKLGDTIIDGTLVDPVSEMVYAFVTTTVDNDNAVYQFAANFTGGQGNGATTGTETGTGSTGYYFYSGNFDNVYYSSTNGTAGNLWVMGNTANTDGTGGSLYRIPIGSTGAMAGTAVTAIPGLTDTRTGQHPWPSPITEFCNNGISDCTASGTATTAGTDYIFFSVDRLATAIGTCGTESGDGCVLGYDITTPTAPTPVGGAKVPTLGTPGCWSTSAIEVDNSVPASGTGSLAGASQIYLLEFNGNTAGGPTEGTYTSSACSTSTAHNLIALQVSQSALE